MKRLMVAAVMLYMALGPVLACAAYVVCPYDGAYAYGDGYVYCQNGHVACKYAHGYGANRHVLQESCE